MKRNTSRLSITLFKDKEERMAFARGALVRLLDDGWSLTYSVRLASNEFASKFTCPVAFGKTACAEVLRHKDFDVYRERARKKKRKMI